MKTFHIANYDSQSENTKAVAISYASDVPASYTGAKNANLAPTAEMLTEYHDRQIGHDEYAEQYVALLTSRGITAQSLADQYENGTVFLCYDYEDGDISICHRFILAEWLNASGVVSVTEL